MATMHDAKDFHPMLGHVEDGAIVRFDDGSKAIIKASMNGWRLVNEVSADLIVPVSGAYAVLDEIVRLNGDRG